MSAMRILVHEVVSSGGFSGRVVPSSLLTEGLAMRAALVADLSAIPDVSVVTVPGGQASRFAALAASADAIWPIAPETDGCLARLTARIESMSKMLLGSTAEAVRAASDKGALARRFAQHGVPYPESRVVRRVADAARLAATIGYPVIVKPVRGAGCDRVHFVRRAAELHEVVARARGPLVVQRYVRGVAASVSLLADGRTAVPLTLNGQRVRKREGLLSYAGGTTPLDHPRANVALETAVRACEALPGLRGFVGVDLVLTGRDAVVIEVNPRLTTAYLGVRAAVDANVAALALAACRGRLPARVVPRRRVRFDTSGRLTWGQTP